MKLKSFQVSSEWPDQLAAVRALVTIGAISVVLACNNVVHDTALQGIPAAPSCPAEDSSGRYFHPDANIGNGDSFQRRLAEYLNEAGMSPLWCGGDGRATYRLAHLPSGRPAVLISIQGGTRDYLGRPRWAVRTVRFVDPRSSIAQSPSQVKISARTETLLSAAEMTPLLVAMSATLVNAPTWQSATEVEDGSAIVIEARESGTYRIVGRSNVDSAMFELASMFARTAKTNAPDLEDEVYILKKRDTTGPASKSS